MSLLTKWLESLADKIEINSHCLREISPFSKCEQCIQVCPEDALQLKNGKIIVHESNCTACGQCMTTCPAYAIEGTVPTREVIKDTLLFQKDIAPSVREWLYYYQKGVRFVAVPDGELTDKWSSSMSEANQYLTKMSLPLITITSKVPKKEERSYTRRELFKQFSNESKTIVMKSLTPAKWRFNNAAFSLNKAFPDWNFYDVNIDESRCHLCEVCFKTCPQNVFSIADGQLSIHLSACTGCGLCMDVCQENAITIKEFVQPAQVINMPFYNIACPSCKIENKSWNEDIEECFVCKKRKSLFYLN